MRVFRLVFSVILALGLCSCAANEPNNIAYVVALGLDKSEGGSYDVTIQFAKTAEISGGGSEEGGKGGSNIIQNITVEAPGIYPAINMANHVISKKFSMSHSKLIVFSKELAQEGIGDLIDTIVRSEELRPDVFIAVAQNSAKEYLNGVKPVIEVNPAKYYQLIYGENEAGGMPKTNLQTFYFDKELQTKNSAVPIAGVTDSEGENKSHDNAAQNEEGFEYRVKNYKAGEIAVSSESQSEAIGMAVFDGDKMIGEMGSIDGEIYNILSGDIKQSFINFRKSDGNSVSAKIHRLKKPSYDIDRKNKKIKIKLFLESDLYDKPYNDENFDIKLLENDIKNEINTACEKFLFKTRDEMGCDILGLGIKLKHQFLTNEQYYAYDFKLDFKNYDIEVDTEFEIRRIGMKV